MTIKLHGMTYSNYYNMVKAAMLENNVGYKEVHVLPNQDSDFLQKSPMGKVPCLETDEGFITETSVIIDYVDSVGAGASLYPANSFAKAKVQELMRHLELYIELPGRRLYGDAFFSRPATDELKAEVKAQLEKGFISLAKIAKYGPWLAGAEFSYADLYLIYSLGPVTQVCKKVLAWDLYAEYPELSALVGLIKERASIIQVAADQAKAD